MLMGAKQIVAMVAEVEMLQHKTNEVLQNAGDSWKEGRFGLDKSRCRDCF